MIGIFDSGLGGLTVFKEIERALPEYDYVYLGDNARAPYGDHSQETIFAYTTQALDYLLRRGCHLVILACNTASAEALRVIQQTWLPQNYPGRTVLGVIRPLAEVASQTTKNNRIGVLGTRSTISSHAYRAELQKLNKAIVAVEKACRLLAPLIEEGFEGKPELRMILKRYMRSVKDANIDTLILGCTHYEIISEDIKRIAGKNVRVLNSGTIVAEKLKEYLVRHPEHELKLSRGGTRTFLMTEKTEMVSLLIRKFLGTMVEVENVVLTQ